jgi:hypothetical protein
VSITAASGTNKGKIVKISKARYCNLKYSHVCALEIALEHKLETLFATISSLHLSHFPQFSGR